MIRAHLNVIRLTGKDRVEFIEHLTVADVKNLAIYNGMYSLIPNEKGPFHISSRLLLPLTSILFRRPH